MFRPSANACEQSHCRHYQLNRGRFYYICRKSDPERQPSTLLRCPCGGPVPYTMAELDAMYRRTAQVRMETWVEDNL